MTRQSDRESFQKYLGRAVYGLQRIGEAAGPMEAHNLFAQCIGFIDYADMLLKNKHKVGLKTLLKAGEIEAEIHRRVIEMEGKPFALKPVVEIDREKVKEMKTRMSTFIVKPRIDSEFGRSI